jgi:hypothetical protein
MDFCVLNFAGGYEKVWILDYPASKLNHYVPFLSMNFKEHYHFGGKVGPAWPKAPNPSQAIPL